MGLRLSDYINEDNAKLTQEQTHDFLIDYGFTDLQLTNDNSIQSIPLSNEEFEKLTSIRVNEERE